MKKTDNSRRIRAVGFTDKSSRSVPIRITHLDGRPVPARYRALSRTTGKSLLSRLPQIQDISQRKAGRNLAVFLVMILILTFISRGTAAAALARVTTASISADEVVQSVRGSGTVRAGNEIRQLPPEALEVSGILASPGQQVTPGTPLLAFDKEEVERQLAQETVKLKESRLKLERLQQEMTSDESDLIDARNKAAWAQEDYDEACKAEDKKISAAQRELDSARSEFDTANNEISRLENAEAAEAPDVPESELTEEESEEYFQTGDQPDLTSQQDQAKENAAAAWGNVTAAQEALNSIRDDKGNNLKSFKRELENANVNLKRTEAAAEKSRLETENSEKSNVIEAENLQLEIQDQEKKLSKLEELKASDGLFRAERTGTVEKLPEIGTSENTAVLLSDTEGGYEVIVTVDEEEAKSLTVGMDAEVEDSSSSLYGGTVYSGIVKEISAPDADKNAEVKITLPEREWKQGTNLEVRMVKKTLKHPVCVPLSAVRSNSGGNFVYIIERRSSVLGAENVLIEIPVTLLLSGDSSAAIDGAISQGDTILLDSTKPVSAGDRVRLNS